MAEQEQIMSEQREQSEKLTFEQALDLLEKSAHRLDEKDVSLEEAIRIYEEGVKYYKLCDEILKSAKQKIETIRAAE